MIVVIAIVAVLIAIGAFVYFNFGTISASFHKEVNAEELDTAKDIHELVNKQRVNAGLQPLAWNEDAAVNARAWAKHLVDSKTYEHSNDYCHGQNIVDMNGPFSPEEVVKAWMNSQPHKDNIKQPAFSSEGIGVYQKMVVENFC